MATDKCSPASTTTGQPGQYESIWQAQAAATQRGIYRVTYVRGSTRTDFEPFGIVATD